MLNNLITSLKARYIFLIENDFHYETEVLTALSKFVLSNSFHFKRITTALEKIEKPLADHLLDFRRDFEALPHNKVLWPHLLPDDLPEYLKQIGDVNLLTHEAVDALSRVLGNPEIAEIFLRSGIFRNATTHYDILIENLKSIPNTQFVYYRGAPAQAQIEEFTNDLHLGIRETGSEFYIGIIDKMLGEGSDESGKAFIEKDLFNIKYTTTLKGLTFLFTTQPVLTMPQGLNDFFKREINKEDQDLIETIKSYLTDASFATVFEELTKDYKTSADYALDLTLKNQANIKHIVSESMNEGVSPYDSLNIWYDLLIKSKREELNIKSIKYHSSLARFFDNNSNLRNHENIVDYGQDLQKLNAFELFDFNVNEKKLPIYPGDIFECNGEYFILIGQACDTLLRENLTRGSKIAEFLKIEVKSVSDFKEKYSIEVRSNKKYVTIQHFFNPILEIYQAIDIEISIKNTYYGDFECIDLCYFSDDGASKIDLTKLDLEDESFSYAEHKVEYYLSLKNFFQSLYSFPVALNKAAVSDAYVTSNVLGNRTGDILNFGFKRISRLKDRFYDSLYSQVIVNKSRIDLNLVDTSHETFEKIELEISYENTNVSQTIEAQLKNTNGNLSIDLKHLSKAVDDNFKNRIDTYSRILVERQANEYELKRDDTSPNKYKLIFSIRYIDQANKQKAVQSDGTVRISRLSGIDKNVTDKSFTFLDDGSQGDFSNAINVGELTRGIKLNADNSLITLQKGTIKVEKE